MTLDRREFVVAAASVAGAFPLTRRVAMTDPPPPLQIGDDPLGVRADFPDVTSRTFLNGAYITPSPRPSIAAAQAFATSKGGPLSVGDLLRKVGEVRGQFARLVNATPDEIGFLYATTEGENVLANTLPMASGDNVVVDELSYEGAFVVYRELERRRGVELRIVPHTAGTVSPDAIAAHVDGRTRLVSLAWVSHLNGFRHDLAAVAEVAHRHGAHFHTDAIQGLGTLTLDVRATGVDSLCAGTYKGLLGGFGIAPFYLRRERFEALAPDRFGIFGVDQELTDHRFRLEANARRYDYATLPFAEVYQLGASLGYLDRVGIPRIEEHLTGLARRLQEGLAGQGVRLFTPPGTRSSIVSFYTTRPAAELESRFAGAGIDVTVRDDHVRASVAIFNVADEVDHLLSVTRAGV